MEEKSTYINILVNTLRRKYECLSKLKQLDENLEELIKDEDVLVEDFEEIIEHKDSCIKELENLDKGFETVYDRVRDELINNKDAYKEEIISMQKFITLITDLTVELKANEERNKKKMNTVFAQKKNQVKNNRIGSQMASNYYKNMSNQHQSGQSYFLDTKN